MTLQEKADELLLERQERRRRGIAPERRLDATANVRQPSAARQGLKQKKPLPRYVTRVRLEGGADIYSFQASPVGPRVPLRGEPGTTQFHCAYNEALVDAAFAEDDRDDWTELQCHHEAHRKGVSQMKKSHRPPKEWIPEKGNLRTNKASAAREHEPVTIDRVERGLAVLAYLMTLDGPEAVAPLYEALERELAAMRQSQDTVGRAKRLLESYSGLHPCLSLAPPLASEDKPNAGVHSTAPQL